MSNVNDMSQPGSLVKTAKNIRLQTVRADKSFQSTSNNFVEELTNYLITNGYLDTAADFIHCNKAIIEKLCTRSLIEKYDKLLALYALSDEEFWASILIQKEPFPVYMNSAAVEDAPIVINMSENKEYLSVNIYPFATEADWERSWPTIKDLLKSRPGYIERLRGVDNPSLIHAIAKARKSSIKWKILATLINTNSLDGYERKKGDKRDWDEGTLKSHFHKNKKYVALN